jgi:hypothetical protein
MHSKCKCKQFKFVGSDSSATLTSVRTADMLQSRFSSPKGANPARLQFGIRTRVRSLTVKSEDIRAETAASNR